MRQGFVHVRSPTEYRRVMQADVASMHGTDAMAVEFEERAGALGVRVARVATSTDAAAFAAKLALECRANPIVSVELGEAAPGFLAEIEAMGSGAVLPGDPSATRDQPLGISLARLAIAETGSVLLAEQTLADRAVGMLTKTHCVLCPTSSLVLRLDDAAPMLRDIALTGHGAYATLVTGPSRTADIELSLTVGVQGPALLAMLFVDALT